MTYVCLCNRKKYLYVFYWFNLKHTSRSDLALTCDQYLDCLSGTGYMWMKGINTCVVVGMGWDWPHLEEIWLALWSDPTTFLQKRKLKGHLALLLPASWQMLQVAAVGSTWAQRLNDIRPWHCCPWSGMQHVCCLLIHIEIWPQMQLWISAEVCNGEIQCCCLPWYTAQLHRKDPKNKKLIIIWRAARKKPTQFVWIKQTNPFFTLTHSKYHTRWEAVLTCHDLPTSQFVPVM